MTNAEPKKLHNYSGQGDIMGATNNTAAATSTPPRRSRAQPAADGQTQFLYLILKQLDLKSINWQDVADGIGIKNGHAARMRWSRFKSQTEGLPTQHQKKQQKKKDGDAKDSAGGRKDSSNRDGILDFKRGFGATLESDMADDCPVGGGGGKRVKLENHHGAYGVGGPLMGVPPPGWPAPYGPPPLPPRMQMPFMGPPPPPFPTIKHEPGMHVKSESGIEMSHHQYHYQQPQPPVPPPRLFSWQSPLHHMVSPPIQSNNTPTEIFTVNGHASPLDPDDLPIKKTQMNGPSSVTMTDLHMPPVTAPAPVQAQQGQDTPMTQNDAEAPFVLSAPPPVEEKANQQSQTPLPAPSDPVSVVQKPFSTKNVPLSAIPAYAGDDPNVVHDDSTVHGYQENRGQCDLGLPATIPPPATPIQTQPGLSTQEPGISPQPALQGSTAPEAPASSSSSLQPPAISTVGAAATATATTAAAAPTTTAPPPPTPQDTVSFPNDTNVSAVFNRPPPYQYNNSGTNNNHYAWPQPQPAPPTYPTYPPFLSPQTPNQQVRHSPLQFQPQSQHQNQQPDQHQRHSSPFTAALSPLRHYNEGVDMRAGASADGPLLHYNEGLDMRAAAFDPSWNMSMHMGMPMPMHMPMPSYHMPLPPPMPMPLSMPMQVPFHPHNHQHQQQQLQQDFPQNANMNMNMNMGSHGMNNPQHMNITNPATFPDLGFGLGGGFGGGRSGESEFESFTAALEADGGDVDMEFIGGAATERALLAGDGGVGDGSGSGSGARGDAPATPAPTTTAVVSVSGSVVEDGGKRSDDGNDTEMAEGAACGKAEDIRESKTGVGAGVGGSAPSGGDVRREDAS